MSRRLLILSCSQRKKADPSPLPALSRYDGPCYRILHKLQRRALLPNDLQLLILSAEHGLLSATQLIDCYDRRMTPDRAHLLSSTVGAQLDKELRAQTYTEVFVNMGRSYLPALASSSLLPKSRVIYAAGGIGQKMAQMRKWILSSPTSLTTVAD